MNQTDIETLRQMSDGPTIIVTLFIAIIAILTAVIRDPFDNNN
uniref:Uncharacterized protein n=1 Tax=viral metagenome TaxID=1070528 RepID=A0A6C0CRQ6_9ZZZZ